MEPKEDSAQNVTTPPVPAEVSSNPSETVLKKQSKFGVTKVALACLVLIVLVAALVIKARYKRTQVSQTSPGLTTANSQTRKASLDITDKGFTPATLTISAGTVVTWTNHDNNQHAVTSDPHPTHTSLPNLFSESLGKDQSYSYTFLKPGKYTYHDHLNPYKLHGMIVVE